MRYSNLIKIAFKSLYGNKTRAILTMLGIIIGISSVIIILALGAGTKDSMRGELASMGTNLINIRPKDPNNGSGARLEASAMQSLKVKDYEDLEKESKYIKYVSPLVSSGGQVIYGSNNSPTTVYGCTPDFLEINNYTLEKGAMFSNDEIKRLSKVCVIGADVVKNIFPTGENPIGKTIRYNSMPLTVVGTIKSKGLSGMMGNVDDFMLMPYTTVQRRILAIDYINAIYVSALSEEHTAAAKNEITNILRRNHKITDPDADNFAINSQDELMESMDTILNLLTSLLAFIAGISLLVGGIGIMNIMYVSVTERTREIGLRMSIGAQNSHILTQFLIESIIISLIGGIFGIVLGWGISSLAGMLLNVNAKLQISSIIIGVGACTFCGVFFGWYPAKRAANLNPIDALRYE